MGSAAPIVSSRRAPLRVYRVVCQVCAASGPSPERMALLARLRERLGLTRAEAAAVERAARASGALRIGRGHAERSFLRAALIDLLQAGSPLKGRALAILRRTLEHLARAGRSPFEDSGLQDPIIAARAG